MTKNPIIWFQYLCWNIHWWMWQHKPYYPRRLRFWLRKRYPDTEYFTKQQVEIWKKVRKGYQGNDKIWPWYVGDHGFGPFVPLWNRVANIFRKFTGGRSHRCEFTDPYRGALYGYKEGAFMNKHFEQLIRNISDDFLDR